MHQWRNIVTWIVIGCAFAFVDAATSMADLRGHTFTDPTYQVSITRPDYSWELRSKLPLKASLAAFVVGEQTSAAVLLHEKFEDNHLITDASDFAERRESLALEIAQIAVGSSAPLTITRTDFDVQSDRIEFDLVFDNFEPERGELTNWVHGMILRRSDGQHIYAVRCATSPSQFGSWESQFERVVSSLAYHGEVISPVYMSRPIPIWWWLAGGAGLFLLAGMFRGSQTKSRRLRIPRHSHGGQKQSPDVAIAPLPPRPDGDPITPAAYDSEFVGGDDVPDIRRVTAGGGSAHSPIADVIDESDMAHPVPHMFDPHDSASALPAGYWTCDCGRKNPNGVFFCSRCNADRA